MQLVPQEIFLTKGVGTHKEQLISFELSLREAGIPLCNLVPVSSVFPANCHMIPREDGLRRLVPGAITFCVLARQCIKEADQHVSAGIGLAIPKDRTICGYISEHHGIGMDGPKTESYVEQLAQELLMTAISTPTNGPAIIDVPTDAAGRPDVEFDTSNITASHYSERDDVWTTVLAAAVFIL